MFEKSPRNCLLSVVLLIQVMVAVDVSVVNVALSDMRGSLGIAPGDLTWVVNAYALTFGGLMMLGGRVGDLIGRYRTLATGLAVFGAASLLGGLARTPGQLIAARAAQGVGAAVLTPIAFTLIAVHFPGPERARALGLWGAAAGVGGSFGVLIGGVLTDLSGWRAVMFVNVPFAVLALVAMRGFPADHREGVDRRIDVAGALLVTAGSTLLVYGVIRTDSRGWAAPSTALTLAVAVGLLAAFVVVERHVQAPLLRVGLFRRRPVVAANLIAFLLFGGQFAAFYFVSLYVQQVLGYSPAATGAAFLPFAVGVIGGSVGASRIIDRTGPRRLLALGGAIAAGGMGLAALTMTPDGTFLGTILGPTLLISVGIGLMVVPVGTVATAGVAPHEAGMASGLVTSSRQLGGSFGLAAVATAALTVTDHHGGDRVAALAAGYAAAIGISAGLLAIAALVALVVLPADAVSRRRRRAPAAPPAPGSSAPASSAAGTRTP